MRGARGAARSARLLHARACAASAAASARAWTRCLRTPLLLPLLVLLCAARAAHAAVLPASTFAQLTAAVAAATPADVVLLSASFTLPSIIALPAGANVTVSSVPGGCAGGYGGLCTLDGGGATSHFSLAAGAGGAPAAALTLRAVALVNGWTAVNSGGAILTLAGSSLTLVDCVLNNNTAYKNGGAVGDSAATVVLLNTSITRNTARLGNGGGVSTIFAPAGGTVTAVGSTFALNSAATNGGGLSSGQAALVQSSTFVNNTSGQQGGGLWANAATVVNSSFLGGNVASSSGGGLSAMASLTLSSSSLVGNAASANGGGVLLNGGSVTVTDCTLSLNLAINGGGGGMVLAASVVSLALTRVNISGNNARLAGGGILAAGGAVTLSACSLTGNQAASAIPRGGGLSFEGASGSLNVSNSAFMDNSVLIFASNSATLLPGSLGGAAAAAVGQAAAAQLAAFVGGTLARTSVPQGLSAASGFGGGLHVYAFPGGALSVALANTPFVRNSAPQGAAIAVGAAVAGVVPGRVTLTAAGCAYAGNVASGDGGALYLLSNAGASFTGCDFEQNVAGGSGGALRLGGAGSSSSFSGGSITGNTAYTFGGALYAAGGGHAVTLSGASVTNNSAAIGGAFFWGTPPAGAPPLPALAALSGIAAAGNAALAGALHGYDPFVNASALVPCAPGCAMQTAAGAYVSPTTSSSDEAADTAAVAVVGTAPVSMTLASSTLTAAPAGPLPLRATLLDAFGQVVPAWPGVTVLAAMLPAGVTDARREGLQGAAAAAVAGGGAAFPSLTLHGFVNATYALRVSAQWAPAWAARVGAATSALLAASAVNATATVTPCAPLQAFDDVNSDLMMICVCVNNASPGAGPASAACACNAGFAADANNATCAACPAGVTCANGGYIYTDAGGWRATAGDVDSFVCPIAEWCAATAAPGAAANCSEGHGGPLCAVCCAPGVAGCDPAGPTYALQAQSCVACRDDAPFAAWPQWKRAVLLFFVVIIAGIVIFFGFFIALLPGAAAAGYRAVSRVRTAARGFRAALCGAPPVDKAAELARASRWLAAHHRALPHALSGLAHSPSQIPRFSTAAVDDGEAPPAEAAEADAAIEHVRHERRKHNFLVMRERVRRALQPVKVLVNFLQVVMTLPKTLRVRWPHIFYAIAARISVVNVNLLSLPSLSCANPDPSYYRVFHGYTLGLAAALFFLGAIYLAGWALHAHLRRRRHGDAAAAADAAAADAAAADAAAADAASDDATDADADAHAERRFYRFTNRVVMAAMIIAYYAYPAVSAAVLGMFSCQALPNGVGGVAYYLRADYRISCYTPKHRAYVAAAAFWVIVYPVGIPVAFWLLLRHFGVARMARERVAAAWLCAAADWAARHAGLACPPGLDTRRLTPASISDEYLAALWGLYCCDAPEEAAPRDEEAKLAAASGGSAGGKPAHGRHRVRGWLAGLRARRSRRLSAAAARAAPAAEAEAAPPPGREEQLAELLRWCARSELLSIPPLQWPLATRLEEAHEQAYARAAPPLPPTPAEEHAEARIGFAFEAYTVQCYYFEVIEMCRKLLLTGVMALVRPGSVAQIVMGLLVAFAAMLLYAQLAPYASRGVNRLSFVAQVNVFLFLLVALLLHIRVDGQPEDSRMYNGIVGTLSLWVFLVPPLNKLLQAMDDDVEADGDDAG